MRLFWVHIEGENILRRVIAVRVLGADTRAYRIGLADPESAHSQHGELFVSAHRQRPAMFPVHDAIVEQGFENLPPDTTFYVTRTGSRTLYRGEWEDMYAVQCRRPPRPKSDVVQPSKRRMTVRTEGSDVRGVSGAVLPDA